MIVFYGLLFDSFTFDFSLETGVLGFLDPTYLTYNLLVLGLFTGAVSLVTEAHALNYFSPLIVINVLLFEPIIS